MSRYIPRLDPLTEEERDNISTKRHLNKEVLKKIKMDIRFAKVFIPDLDEKALLKKAEERLEEKITFLEQRKPLVWKVMNTIRTLDPSIDCSAFKKGFESNEKPKKVIDESIKFIHDACMEKTEYRTNEIAKLIAKILNDFGFKNTRGGKFTRPAVVKIISRQD